MEQDDHRARGLVNDPVDQVERVLRAAAEPDERHVGALPGRDLADVLDLDLACDHLVSQGDHDRGYLCETVLSLIGDQDAQALALTGDIGGYQYLPAPRPEPGGCALFRLRCSGRRDGRRTARTSDVRIGDDRASPSSATTRGTNLSLAHRRDGGTLSPAAGNRLRTPAREEFQHEHQSPTHAATRGQPVTVPRVRSILVLTRV